MRAGKATRRGKGDVVQLGLTSPDGSREWLLADTYELTGTTDPRLFIKYDIAVELGIHRYFTEAERLGRQMVKGELKVYKSLQRKAIYIQDGVLTAVGDAIPLNCVWVSEKAGMEKWVLLFKLVSAAPEEGGSGAAAAAGGES